MKKLFVFVFTVMMSVSSFANTMNPTSKKEDVKQEIRTKIVELLGKVDFSFDKELKTTVDLMVNKKGEIVVLNVNSDNQNVEDYIKRKLNYKKVVSKLKTAVKIYKMPLRIVK